MSPWRALRLRMFGSPERIGLSVEAQRVLDEASHEAAEQGHSSIDVGHLLAGLLRIESGGYQDQLVAAGVTLEKCRQALRDATE